MDRVNSVYVKFLFLECLFAAVASVLYAFMLGYGGFWATYIEIFCLIFEIILFIYMFKYLSKKAKEIMWVESPGAVTYLFDQVRTSNIYIMAFSLVFFFLPDVSLCVALLGGGNVFIFGFFFFVLLTIKKIKIEKRK